MLADCARPALTHRGQTGRILFLRRVVYEMLRSPEMRSTDGFSQALRFRLAAALMLLLCVAACGQSTTPPPKLAQTATAEPRHFTGTWSASGTRQGLDLGPGHRADVIRLSGSLMLSGKERLNLGFKSEVIGFRDSLEGFQGRSVWTDEHGAKVFSVLQSKTTGAAPLIEGRFIGGTGRYAGVTGEYSFTWQPLRENEDGGVSGRVVGLKGWARQGTTVTSPQPAGEPR